MFSKTILNIILILFISSYSYAATNYCNDASNKGCWGMENDSTTEQDLSTNNEDLSEISGTIPTSADHQFGDFSRDFEAGDSEWLSHVDGGSTDISGANQAISLTAWVKFESHPSAGATAGVITKYRTDTNQRQYQIAFQQSSDSFICIISSAGTSGDGLATGVTDLSDGVWYHVACVYDDTDIRV